VKADSPSRHYGERTPATDQEPSTVTSPRPNGQPSSTRLSAETTPISSPRLPGGRLDPLAIHVASPKTQRKFFEKGRLQFVGDAIRWLTTTVAVAIEWSIQHLKRVAAILFILFAVGSWALARYVPWKNVFVVLKSSTCD
jgi:hypothetical protein